MAGFGYPNAFCYFVFFAFLPIAVGFLAASSKPLKTLLIVYLGGILFMPERIEYDLPLIPPIAKGEIAALSCLLGAMIKLQKRIFKLPPGLSAELVVPLIIVGAVITASQNTDPMVIGNRGEVVLPGHDFMEGVGLGIRELFQIGIPFFLGRLLFRDEHDLKLLVTGFATAALIYTPFIWFELRMSPQAHNYVYGFMQHFFGQTVRFGGYRPMVFMQHGLAVAMLMLSGTVAAFTSAKAGLKILKFKAWPVAYYLFVVLVLCKSVAAIILGCLVLPLIKWGKPKRQVQLITIFCAITVIYPTLKVTDTFPSEAIVAAARALINEERGQSMEFRFQNDEILVEKAQEKLWFGWGGYGRSRIYDWSGKDISVTDGYWVIHLGARGIVGLYGNFALLLIPLWFARKRIKNVQDKQQRMLLTGLAFMVALFTVDLLPNGLYNSFPFFLAGALASLSAALGGKQRARRPVVAAPPQALRHAA